MQVTSMIFTSSTPHINKKQSGRGGYFLLVYICILIALLFISGCSGSKARSLSREANDFFNQGEYEAALGKYQEIIEIHPDIKDRVLFEMGTIYAHPRNDQKDYNKALDCYQAIVREFPESAYRQDSEMMIFQIHNVINKDKIIAAQKKHLEASRQELNYKETEIDELQEKLDTLEQQIIVLQADPADKVLIEKKERRLTLLSNGEVIKTYKIALGGNPVGPKERQGDNKTPEGLYTIESRNRNSGYYLSLRISYPNEKDKKRARELGVSPGGDIMIHGIKNGLSWVGSVHSKFDWTKGCIAVTDEEMDEIDRLVPDGTVVEILP